MSGIDGKAANNSLHLTSHTLRSSAASDTWSGPKLHPSFLHGLERFLLEPLAQSWRPSVAFARLSCFCFFGAHQGEHAERLL